MRFILVIDLQTAPFDNQNGVNVVETEEIKSALTRVLSSLLLGAQIRVGSGRVMNMEGQIVGDWEIVQ